MKKLQLLLILSLLLLSILLVSASKSNFKTTSEYGCYEFSSFIDECKIVYSSNEEYNMVYLQYTINDNITKVYQILKADSLIRSKQPWSYINYSLTIETNDSYIDSWYSHSGRKMYHGIFIQGKSIIDAVIYENKG